MVLAMRPLIARDEQIIKAFLDKIILDGENGVAYALTDAGGNIIASGTSLGGRNEDVNMARLRAVASIGLRKDTADVKACKTGNEIIDDMYSGGGVLIVANGIIYGAIGVAGRSKPNKMFPGKTLWDHEIAYQLSENLKFRSNIEGDSFD